MPTLAETFVEVTGDFSPLRRDAQEAGDQAGAQAGGAFSDRMKLAVAAGAAAIGAGLIVGLQGAIAQSAGRGLLAAQLGATPAEAERLGRLAGSLYAGGFGANMEEVNAALRAVVQNGIVGLQSTDTEIQRVAGNVTNLAALLGEDADRVSMAISQMLRTGMAQSAEEAFDILAAASQRGINKAQDLLDTTNEYSTQFRKLGLDGTTAFGLISQAIQAGARDSDVAADALKEFSIRIVDGSKEAADSLTALGFNAEEMRATFARGGPEAAAALDQVLDRLRATQGRADAASIAFGLFGTQSEDLGQALYSMDLSSAATQLGKVEGAAAAAGDTMANTAAGQVEVFKRQVEQGLVNATAAVIPKLQELGGWINRNREWLVPFAATVGSVIAVVWLINTAIAAWTAATAALNAVHLISGVRLAATTAAAVVHTAVTRGIAIATNIWAVAQWALNAALTANPVGVVVVAIGALIAALVLAYRNSETFRNVVQAAWEGIKVAASAVWNTVLKPIFDAISWYITTVVGPVWMWLWENVIAPAAAGIRAAVQVAWTVIQVVLGALEMYIRNVVVPTWMWLYEHVAKPVFAGISAAVEFMWSRTKLVFDVLREYIIGPLVTAFLWTRDALTTAWTFVRDHIANIWNGYLRPLFTLVGGFITDKVVPAFRSGVEAIGNAWDRMRDLARKPVEFVVNYVVNPLVRGYNAIARRFGGDTVEEIKGFHGGGRIWDGLLPGEPSDEDNILAAGPRGKPLALATGEYVVNARSTSKHIAELEAINADRYADGGLIGWLSDPIGSAKKAFGGVLGRLDDLGDTPFAKILKTMPRRIFDMAVAKVKSLFTFTSDGGGGAGPGFPPWPSSPSAQRGDSGVWRSIMAMVRASGIPYSFGNAYRHGDPLWHGSGRAIDFMGYNQDRLASFFESMRPRVLELIHRTRTRDYGITRGRNRPFPTQWPLHENHIHIAMAEGGMVADSGGFLAPGWNPPVFNGTGKPEALVPDGMRIGLDDDTIGRLAAAMARALNASSARTLTIARTL